MSKKDKARSEIRYAVVLLLLCCTGCSLLYDQNVEGHGFKIHSNQDAEFVEDVRLQTSRIRHAYQTLFNLSNEELGTITIFLKGDSSDKKNIKGTSLLGYYLSFLNWKVIDTSIEK